MTASKKRSLVQKPKAADTAGTGVGRAAMSEPAHSARNIRETVESIIIAFVLAFLFRTFEAEAFVIPTGSMAPTLRGRHKDVECPKCGFRYQASASMEVEDESGDVPPRLRHLTAPKVVVSTTCPMCRYAMPAEREKSYSGDRILVNKFAYQFSDPDRFDVIVFKYPGDAKMNYIKRLVGLPGEEVRIWHGDIFIKPKGADEFTIARKPPHKIKTNSQQVHDIRFQPRELVEKNWPMRWQAWPTPDDPSAKAWVSRISQQDASTVQQMFSLDGTSPGTSWIRYQHLIPSWESWEQLRDGTLPPEAAAQIRPQLITDFYAYNTSTTRDQPDQLDPSRLGLHWVGDLVVECELEALSQHGQVLLDLVEAGRHYQCQIDLESGKATLSIQGLAGFAPQASTSVRGAGKYTLTLANVDDQLLLWVHGKLVEFDAPTSYSSEQLGSRRPRSTADDAGDLAPVGIGARGAALSVTGLRVLRDTYYIADKHGQSIGPITDFAPGADPLVTFSSAGASDFLSNPNQWDVFDRLRWVDFPLADDQFFVLGDNSPFSKDGRLWDQEHFGHYVERQLLIGEALFVYWPHSWNRIPGTPIPLPFFPNFSDMGLVR